MLEYSNTRTLECSNARTLERSNVRKLATLNTETRMNTHFKILLLVLLAACVGRAASAQDTDAMMERFKQHVQAQQYVEAIEVGERLLSLYSEPSDADVEVVINLGYCYKNLGDYNRAIEYYSMKPRYWESNKLVGDCYLALGDIDMALCYYNQVDYALLLGEIAQGFADRGDYDHAIEFVEKAKQRGDLDDDRGWGINQSLAYYYFAKGDSARAYTNILLAATKLQPIILRGLRLRTAASRASYWGEYSSLFQHDLPVIACVSGHPLAARYVYDLSALFAKGMLLSTDTEFDRLVDGSGDSEAIEAKKELLALRSRIKSINEQHGLWDRDLLDSLNSRCDSLEEELLLFLWEQHDAMGDFTQDLKVTWKDVRARLGAGDLAIEFFELPVADYKLYIALTIRPGYSSPKMTVLCDNRQLEAEASQAYTTQDLSWHIWGQLAAAGELDTTVRNIYFSPCGQLHTVAIESLPHWDKAGTMVSDEYNIYRLSSTRELVISHPALEASGAAVYGGIRYETNVQAMGVVSAHAGQPSVDSRSFFRPAQQGFADARGIYWSELAGTRIEANEVNKKLRSQGIEVNLKTDAWASEASFKALSGQRIRLMHIATHGFYWSDSTTRQVSRDHMLAFTRAAGDNGVADEQAMTRTGLLFTGAANTFRPDVTVPDSIEDGVLTAHEVAQLDLRGLDLLVLSACQTGLGEIGGDGVFGLQRGFKKAGAQTIIMSLWKVNDLATRDMMIRFYTNYIDKGMSKHEAFVDAQRWIKHCDEVEHKYDYSDPDKLLSPDDYRRRFPHWAAFIMLDGE